MPWPPGPKVTCGGSCQSDLSLQPVTARGKLVPPPTQQEHGSTVTDVSGRMVSSRLVFLTTGRRESVNR